MTRSPAILESRAEASPWSWAVLLVRSLHGLAAMPAKPPEGKIIWKMLSVSGNEWKTL
jgi:hypothetical protein